ncbi:MAG: EscU/YscU/HrcU family type III secretion system export apparatus switch protein, partial [Sedimentisphaerales bacterium]|nr:EscU/YscU/HrcU family type III secretion system export apparatus switch protein [Sedimentisphaerales bacterium]
MPADTGEKTEAPTPRRLQETREKGQVAKSMDLTAAVGLLVGLILLNFYGTAILNGFMSLVRQSLTLDDAAITGPLALDEGWRMALRHVWAILAPIFMLTVVAAIVINVLQVGFVFASYPITPSFEKISPLTGIKRLFSVQSAMRLIMSLAKVGIIGMVAFYTIKGFLPNLISVAGLSFTEVVGYGAHLVFILGMRMAMVLLLLALFDYAFQKYKFAKDLRMTKEEVKEEMKRMEGDPIMRQRRRNVARQLAMQRMSQAVPNADVVVTNPTHLAIALKYEMDTMPAPKVVARGAGFIAHRIREIALENGVPVIERKPLAQALYK